MDRYQSASVHFCFVHAIETIAKTPVDACLTVLESGPNWKNEVACSCASGLRFLLITRVSSQQERSQQITVIFESHLMYVLWSIAPRTHLVRAQVTRDHNHETHIGLESYKVSVDQTGMTANLSLLPQ